MPTHDYIIANGTGAAVRADINLALSAIVSLNSSASEPGTMYAYQLWADTALGLLKIRNGANSAWITLRQLDGDFSIVAVEDGLQATPSLTFTNDLNTGVFRSGADALAIVTGGQYAITCTSTQAVGIQTANPNAALHVAGNARVGADDVTDAVLEIGVGATGNRASYIDIVGDTTYTDYGLRVIRNNTGANATSELKHRGTGALNFTTEEAAPIVFYTTNSPSMTITSGGLVGIGVSAPQSAIDIYSNVRGVPETSGSTTTVTSLRVRGASNGVLDIGELSSATPGSYWLQVRDKTDLGYEYNLALQPNGGNVGIGTTSPSQKLEIGGAGRSTVVVGSTDSYAELSLVGATTENYITSDDALAFYINSLERLRIDTSGRLLVGTTTALSNFFNSTVSAALQVEGTGNDTSSLSITRNSADVGRAILTLAKTRGGSVGSTTIVQSGDALGSVEFQGSDGTEFVQAAAIQCEVDGTATINAGSFVASRRYKIATVGTTDFTAIGASANTVGVIFTATGVGAGTGTATSEPYANSMPGRLVFSTTADGASSPTERMRITSYGTFLASNAGSYPTTTGTYHAFSANSPDDLILRLNNTSSTNPYGVNVVFDAAAPNDTTRFFLNCADNAALRATIRSNGGLANYSANNANLSDRNVKKDISPAANTWNCIKEWEIVNYRYKDQPDDADLNLGVIAQQVAESCPEVITIFQEAKEATEDKPAQEERLGVKEQQMYWMAIKALQEAMGRIEQLETKVAALESA
jgi:hypothetical protein